MTKVEKAAFMAFAAVGGTILFRIFIDMYCRLIVLIALGLGLHEREGIKHGARQALHDTD